jgi:hypothetical protein
MSSSASAGFLKAIAVKILERLKLHYRLFETKYCVDCKHGCEETAPNGNEIGPFFCEKHQTPLFTYATGWESFHFKLVKEQPVMTTASIAAHHRNVSIYPLRECRDCKDECAPRGPDPHEIGPFLCTEHSSPLFIWCKKDNTPKPLWFNTHDE